MADHNININFPGMQGGAGGAGGGFYQQNTPQNGGSATNFMNQTLQNLNGAIINLNSAINGLTKQKQPASKSDIWDTTAKTIGTTIAAVVGVTLKRFLDIQATAIMNRATSSGQFMASAIKGNANQVFGNYVNSLFQTEKAMQQGRVGALSGGALGIAGGALGSIGGTLLSPFTGGIANPITGAATGAATGAYLGSSFGNYLSADARAKIERQQQVQGALAERAAMASVSEWRTGFSRFGLTRTNREIVPAGLTDTGKAINVPLSQQFEKQYGGSQNYNAILNNIVPNLQSSPLDMQRTGDLNQVSQNFLKAGFAAQDFAKLTLQSTQYQALTGKNIQQFSEYVKDARVKFGDAFDISSMQTSLNLMSIGYNKNQAQNIAFQSQFNPSLMGNVAKFNNLGIQDFYRNKAIGDVLGININESLKTGSFVGSKSARSQLAQELKDFRENKSYGKTMTLLNAASGLSPQDMQSLLQNKVEKLKGAVNEATAQSPAQDRATTEIVDTLRNGLNNIQNMNVTASNVVIMNKNNLSDMGSMFDMPSSRQPMWTPSILPRSSSPTK